MTHTVDVGLQLLVSVYWHVAYKVVVCACRAEKVAASVLGVGCAAQQMLQNLVLQRLWFGEVAFQLMLSGNERIAYDAC